MYNEFYGFREKPFSLTPDPHFLYLSSVHKKALAYLTYGLEDKKGFITVTGEVGAGKTTLIRALLHRIDSSTTVARIINTTVSPLQLLKMILRDFGIDSTSSAKEDLLDSLNEFLLQQYSVGCSAVLIIDEAQNLGTSALEEIRLLSNLETEKDKLLQIILVGQPELRQTMAQPELRQLRQRITVNYHIASLCKEEVYEYVKHRLKVARARTVNIFNEEALEEIARASKGIPRIINIICDAALVTGYVEGKQHIDDKMIKEVLTELNLEYDTSATAYPVFAQAHDPAHPPSVEGLLQNVDKFCQSHQKQPDDFLEQKTKALDKQMKQLQSAMDKISRLEKELDKRAERIKVKEEELGLDKLNN